MGEGRGGGGEGVRGMKRGEGGQVNVALNIDQIKTDQYNL